MHVDHQQGWLMLGPFQAVADLSKGGCTNQVCPLYHVSRAKGDPQLTSVLEAADKEPYRDRESTRRGTDRAHKRTSRAMRSVAATPNGAATTTALSITGGPAAAPHVGQRPVGGRQRTARGCRAMAARPYAGPRHSQLTRGGRPFWGCPPGAHYDGHGGRGGCMR